MQECILLHNIRKIKKYLYLRIVCVLSMPITSQLSYCNNFTTSTGVYFSYLVLDEFIVNHYWSVYVNNATV